MTAPPHDLTAEEALIGTCLVHVDAPEKAVGLCGPEDFYKPAHSRIFAAIAGLHRAGVWPDVPTVIDELRRDGSLESVGGARELVATLAAGPGVGINVAEYARIVADLAQRRRVLAKAHEVREAALGGGHEELLTAVEALRDVGSNGYGAPSRLARRLQEAVVIGEEIRDLPRPASLVADLLDQDVIALLYGASGAKKSLCALGMASSVATGTTWLGRQVTAGPVLYVVAEGVSGFAARAEAWRKHHGVDSLTHLYWLPMAVNLFDPEWTAALVHVVSELRPVLVVIDTLARCMVGGDENSARDVGVVVEAAEQVRRACGSCVLLVHHSGKDESAGARGSSALKAAVSIELECKASHDGGVVIKSTKQRDRPDGEILRLRLVEVAESCVVVPDEDEGDLSRGALDLLRILDEIADEDGVPSGVWESASAVARRSFFRWRKQLLDQGLCHRAGTGNQARFTVSEQGKQVLAP